MHHVAGSHPSPVRYNARLFLLPDAAVFMRQIGLLLLISTVLCACASLEDKQRNSTFETDTAMYAKAIRWGELETAEQLRRLADPQPVQSPPADQARVTSYETLRAKPAGDGNTVTLTVRIMYYHTDGMTLKSVTDQQVWIYDADEQHWYITTPLPEFK